MKRFREFRKDQATRDRYADVTVTANDFIYPYFVAAAAVGVDGFFYETHLNPCEALCDGPNMLNLDELEKNINEILAIKRALNLD